MKQLKKFLPLIGGGLLVLAALFLFLPAVKVGVSVLGVTVWDDPVSGGHAMFGRTVEGIQDLKFNVGMFITFLLGLGAGAVAIVTYFKKNELLSYIALGLGALFFIFAFLSGVFFKGANGLGDGVKIALQVGPILAGIFGILGAGAVAADVFVK
ncbi:MAG: hypothetical protein GX350_02670 [Erysipelotrichaceae bacterium]|nr:hypothetical protein [Erysipelotrichaceae bacterium]